MADHSPTLIKLQQIHGSRLPDPVNLDHNSPEEFLRSLIGKIYIESAPHMRMERDTATGGSLARWKCAHSICPLNEDCSKVGFIDQILTEAHGSLGPVPSPQIGQSLNPYDNILYAFVQEFKRYLTTLSQRQHFQNNGIAARKQIDAALSAFTISERDKVEVCLQPLWRFLFTLVRIAHDLRFADKHSISLDRIDGVKPISQDTQLPTTLVAHAELQAADSACAVCFEPFHTTEEFETWLILFQELPFHPVWCSEKPLKTGEPGIDPPVRTRCGHIFGLGCLNQLVASKLMIPDKAFFFVSDVSHTFRAP
jgi:hypothetical protein